ncbi:MAG TPA: hypothetical protein VJH87_20290 [Vicinamibacteria bacterium]|nr:hypothetical protein [Vicinamibacteria bacterium]
MTETDSRPEGFGKRPPFHKRQFIVDKPFQHRLIGTLMSIWLAYSLFFTIVLYFFYEGHLKRFYTLVPQPGMQPLLTLPMLLTLSMVFVYVFGFIVLSIIALYMSNQVAGPLYRTKLGMERVARGDVGFQLKFRQGDFLNDIPGIFNGMLDSLRRQAEMDVEQVYALEESLGDPVELKRLLREFRQRKAVNAGLETREAAPGGQRQASIVVS